MREFVILWGAYDQTTRRVVIQRAPDQRHGSLLVLIAAFIEPHSVIMSDGWLRTCEMDLVTVLDMHMHYSVNHSTGTFAEQITDGLLGNLNYNNENIDLSIR